jgi:hypothetical protein
MNLVAQSDLTLKAGDRFRAKIQETEPRLLLKIISGEDQSRNLAQDWGIKGEEVKLVQELISAKLPLDKTKFEALNEAIRKFQHKYPQKAEYQELARSAVRLEQANLPLTIENLQRALYALKGNISLPDIFSRLQNLLNDPQSKLPPQLLHRLQELFKHFQSGNIIQNLPAMVKLLGLDNEAELKKLLMGEKLNPEDNLKSLLLALKGNPETETLAEEALQQLESLQMMNLPEFHLDSGDTFYLQFPLWFQGAWEKFEAHFRSGSGHKGALDKDNASIRLNFDTRFLGQVSALVEIVDKHLTLNFNLEEEEAVDFFRSNLPDLEKHLQELDYDLRGISVSMTPPKNEPESPPIWGNVIEEDNLDIKI